jgi:hypothetical protein
MGSTPMLIGATRTCRGRHPPRRDRMRQLAIIRTDPSILVATSTTLRAVAATAAAVSLASSAVRGLIVATSPMRTSSNVRVHAKAHGHQPAYLQVGDQAP